MNRVIPSLLYKSPSILVIEDDPTTLECIKTILESECMLVHCARSGKAALEKISQEKIHLVLIDMHLPDIFGLELFREIKEKTPDTPCIFLSGHQIELDIVLSLQLGAEDYIIKPFKTGELLARIRKVLNRHPHQQKSEAPTLLHEDASLPLLQFAGLTLNYKQRDASLKQHKLKLTKTEFEILYCLASSPEEVMTREKILNHVWPSEETVTDRIIDTHIRQIRKKLKQVLAGSDKFIGTHRGIGYFFDPKIRV